VSGWGQCGKPADGVERDFNGLIELSRRRLALCIIDTTSKANRRQNSMELTPEEKFNAPPPEKLIPKLLAEGADRDTIVTTLIELDWEPAEAAYQVDSYLTKQEGRAMPPRLPVEQSTPVGIVVLCALGFVGAAATAREAMFPEARAAGNWHPIYLLATAIIKPVCYIGMLRMRRWGLIAYFVFFLLDQAVTLLARTWNPLSLIYSLGLLALGRAYWIHLKKGA
jgi:hypothetical protein